MNSAPCKLPPGLVSTRQSYRRGTWSVSIRCVTIKLRNKIENSQNPEGSMFKMAAYLVSLLVVTYHYVSCLLYTYRHKEKRYTRYMHLLWTLLCLPIGNLSRCTHVVLCFLSGCTLTPEGKVLNLVAK